ncbi:MAG: hypothetical protein AB1540_10005 [Bdellovibrionota bacterium]
MQFRVLSLAISICFLNPSAVFAKSELVSKIDWKNQHYKVKAELHYDKETKRPDLWIEYQEDAPLIAPTDPNEKPASFKATSLDERFGGADTKLILVKPIPKEDGMSILVYNAFERATGYYNGDHGMAVLFHYPVEGFSKKDALPAKTLEALEKNFPNSIIRDEAGKPKFIKALLCRISVSQVYPIGAFDLELEL